MIGRFPNTGAVDSQQLVERLSAIVGAENVQPGGEPAPADWTRRPECVVQPSGAPEVAAIVVAAEECGAAILPCGSGSRLATGYPPGDAKPYTFVQTSRMSRLLDYQPDDLTVTCEPGMTLEALQQALSAHRQFLPLDCALPERTTLGGIVSSNSAGFSRASYGTPRDLLIGLRAVMSGGVEVKGGGKVVKNVAGYDVCKLFTGAWGTLGVLTELTFKVRPLNAAEAVLSWPAPDVSRAAEIGLELYHSKIAPAYVLATNEPEGRSALVAGLQGTAARVAWQQTELERLARELGLSATWATLADAEVARLRDCQARLDAGVRLAARIACLPTELPALVSSLERLQNLRMTAQCAVGTLNVASAESSEALTASIGAAAPSTANLLWTRIDPELARRQQLAVWGEARQDMALQRGLKLALDPRGTFSPGRFVGGV